jgi:hypothetical protein
LESAILAKHATIEHAGAQAGALFSPHHCLFLLFSRAKLYKAVHGKDLVFADMKPPAPEPENNRTSPLVWSFRKDNSLSLLFPLGPQIDVTTVATQREESRKILRE